MDGGPIPRREFLARSMSPALAATVQLLLSGSGHTHALSLSAAQVDTNLTGAAVSATSSTNGGHSHRVDFN